MAVASVTTKAQIVHLGAGYEERQSFTAGGVDTIYAGDLIRINDAGTIDVAEAASAGAVHGMALEANAAAATILPIVLFAPDTVLKIQTIDSEAPSDLTKGLVYTLEVSTANKQAITATTTNGVGLVVAYAGDSIPWTSAVTSFDETVTDDNNSVHVRILASVLDGNAAAAS
jgi:hypothetical protein